MTATPSLTVVILTLNEASRIRRCLESISVPAARVVIVDSFSTDRTIEVAQQAWLELGHSATRLVTLARLWQGFTEARNASRAWLQTEWVLWLDADEWLSAELNAELVAWIGAKPMASLARIPRQSNFLGKAIRHGGWYPDYKRRLARTAFCEWRSGPFGADVHEDLYLSIEGASVKFRAALGHESFRSVAEQRETNERYSALLAEGLAQKWRASGRRPPSGSYICLKVLIKFVENYFFKAGILDGVPGFLIARGSAQSLAWRLQKAGQLLREKP